MFEIYDSTGVYWGSAKGSTFEDACSNFFGESEDSFFQVQKGEFDAKELTLYGLKLVPKI
jgi:hypothetical protein